ncbi:MAG: hypothetical protein LBC49_02930 [Bacteroidales bacterium]|jgi:hypothetical protein|nr:hypothetical protein [Bacteroidales bacterium]
MKIIKRLFVILGTSIVTGTLVFCGFAKVYLNERERCMLAHNNDLKQWYCKHVCYENHEYSLQENKVLRLAVYIQLLLQGKRIKICGSASIKDCKSLPQLRLIRPARVIARAKPEAIQT